MNSSGPLHWTSHARTSVVCGAGCRRAAGAIARDLGFSRALLVADAGMAAAGYVDELRRTLEASSLTVHSFHEFGENPDTSMVEYGRAFAASLEIDSLVCLGGGSALDCGKAINFLVTTGGRMQVYRGHASPRNPLLPMIGIPTTTGTGSEAQSYALISDAATHEKMACGAPGAAFRYAVLDPELALTQPPRVLAASGYDALSHAVESYVTTRRNAFSDMYAREAWRLLDANFERALATRALDAIAAMQLGAYFAGAAIEHSMLGATHACANPLTAFYGTVHGEAIALMLPHVTRWNAQQRHCELHPGLPARLEELRAAAGLAPALRVPAADLPRLAEAAAAQWTGRFNPRPFDVHAAQELYRCALSLA